MNDLVGDGWRIVVDDVIRGLRGLPEKSVHCAVTSPPYWGLRDYQTGQWDGGDAACDHVRNHRVQGKTGQRADRTHTAQAFYRSVCGKCGARRIDRQIGSEPTIADFVDTMVSVFRELRRVLRNDGTLWLNCGDTYATGNKWGGRSGGRNAHSHAAGYPREKKAPGLPAKSLCMVPARVAIALQDDGWILRSDIIWHKPNPIPSSVTDRPTTAHEYIYLLSKQPQYFYDAEAVREPQVSVGRVPSSAGLPRGDNQDPALRKLGVRRGVVPCVSPNGRNCRTVWRIATQPTRDAHFATFPQEIPRRAIKAGTSEHGCCAACAAPYRRVLESERVRTRPGRDSKSYDRRSGEVVDDGAEKPWRDRAEIGNRDPGRHISVKRTVGWEATCQCNSELPPVPAVVLDPFAGSGTTLAVALQLGRTAIGIELNPEYARLAEKRIERAMRPGTFRDESKPGDAPLFAVAR